MDKTEGTVDRLRFINKTHTTVRSLVVCNQIVKTIGKKQIPKQFLKEILFKWSTIAEKNSIEYKNHKGKLTNGDKPTTAINHYFDLLNGLGFINNLGDLYGCTKLGLLLNSYEENGSYFLNGQQKFIYFFTLINVDADAIILLINILLELKKPSQKDIQDQFEKYFTERLLQKQKFATTYALHELRKKYTSVHYEWKNTKVYAEHLVVPRLEWMHDLCLVNIERGRNSTYYTIKEEAIEFYNKLNNLPNSNLCDINDIWIKDVSIGAIVPLILKGVDVIYWHQAKKEFVLVDLLNPILQSLFKILSTGGAMRVSLLPGLLYIISELAFKHGIIVEINDLINEFENGIKIDNKQYRVKTAVRITEGYLSCMNLT